MSDVFDKGIGGHEGCPVGTRPISAVDLHLVILPGWKGSRLGCDLGKLEQLIQHIT